jgi:SPP1 gp7 family putative phage head morphogenesis protein
MYGETYQTAADNLKAEMQGYAVHAGEVATATIASQLPASVSFLSMTVDQLESIVSRVPITVGEGKQLLFGELFKSYEAAVVEDITGAVRTGMVLGKSNQDIARAIRQVIIDNGITEKHARYADNLARTITNSVGNRATMATYEKSDVVKNWIFLATLDGRTSITCRALSNTRWPIGEGPLPPRHIGCRSSSVPELKTFRELGIDMDEFKPGMRASKDGLVSSDINMNQWMKTQSNAEIVEMLGPTRAKLFIDGGMKIEKFANDQGTVYTLAELKKRNSAIFDRVFN